MADNNIEERVHEVEKKQIGIETKLDAFIQEMRDRDNQRAEDIRELRQESEKKIERIEKKIDQLEGKFSQFDSKMDSVNRYAHQMFLAAAIGIGAMILTVVVPMIMSPK